MHIICFCSVTTICSLLFPRLSLIHIFCHVHVVLLPRFLLKDTKTNEWYDVGIEYAREKVSHALRSRPNEERRKRNDVKQQHADTAAARSGSSSTGACSNNGTCAGGDDNKATTSSDDVNSSPELEETVKSLIHDQQQLLQSMIQSESFPVYS
jgi:hypothetical protein